MALVLFFGPLSDVSSSRRMALPLGVGTVGDLSAHLGEVVPELGVALSGCGVTVAVNREVATFETAIEDEDEIAFMSPMSGG